MAEVGRGGTSLNGRMKGKRTRSERALKEIKVRIILKHEEHSEENVRQPVGQTPEVLGATRGMIEVGRAARVCVFAGRTGLEDPEQGRV